MHYNKFFGYFGGGIAKISYQFVTDPSKAHWNKITDGLPQHEEWPGSAETVRGIMKDH